MSKLAEKYLMNGCYHHMLYCQGVMLLYNCVLLLYTVRCVPVVTSRWVRLCHVQCALQAAAVHRPVTRPSHVILGHTVVKDPSTVLNVQLATSALPPVVRSI